MWRCFVESVVSRWRVSSLLLTINKFTMLGGLVSREDGRTAGDVGTLRDVALDLRAVMRAEVLKLRSWLCVSPSLRLRCVSSLTGDRGIASCKALARVCKSNDKTDSEGLLRVVGIVVLPVDAEETVRGSWKESWTGDGMRASLSRFFLVSAAMTTCLSVVQFFQDIFLNDSVPDQVADLVTENEASARDDFSVVVLAVLRLSWGALLG